MPHIAVKVNMHTDADIERGHIHFGAAQKYFLWDLF